MKDTLGDYLKSMEHEYNGSITDGSKYLYMRLDGRSFSNLTRSMDKPYDLEFHSSMNETAKALMEEFDPLLVMRQSDEISILWKPISGNTERLYGGKYYKLLSVVPSFAASVLSIYLKKPLAFDARIVEASFEDAIKLFWWRYKDCHKNAISMVISSCCSPKELHGMNTETRFDIIKEKEIWENSPNSFKYGYWLTREKAILLPDDPKLSHIPLKYKPTEPMEYTPITEKVIDTPFVYYSVFEKWFEKFLLTNDNEKRYPE